MDSLLHSAAGALGQWVHSLNPSLMEDTPPFEEVTGSDICFLGPNGENDESLVVFCRDFTMRSLVGSWYLSPTRHALEMLMLSPIFVLVIWKVLPSLMKLEGSRPATKTDHPLGIPTLAACCMAAHLVYKTLGKKLLFLCVPCNVQWQLTVLICFGNWSRPVQGVLYQLLISYCGYTLPALATPDVSDCLFPFEPFFFWFNHIALLVIPVAYLATGRVSLLSPSPTCSILWFNFQWWLVTCAGFGLFYFLPVSLVSIVSGYNLNYMLSPPPGQDLIVGDSYRLMSIGCCGLLIFLTRGFIVVGELLTKPSKQAEKKAD
eukprot:CAMPEP_0113633934 /NCGR_PEP_ID=MMETSP0017_2-20120614/17664_1 /TAXON_ID=2856 /ORGANISM="Cylindrotheca closterium" /LENGTH=317 /DNA_ID=CAMNT_0000544601 /DNA_START=101 /DNA_END=1054 /DNA_ORIENTATION=+ /assembly_acc=CAM_ASM_000147